MANENLTFEAREALASVQDLISIQYAKNPKNADYVRVKNPKTSAIIEFWTNTWAGDDLVELSEVITAWDCGEITWEQLEHYDDSKAVSDNINLRVDNAYYKYVVDSYQINKQNIDTITHEFISKFKEDLKTLNNLKTFKLESSKLVKIDGVYITPYLLKQFKENLKKVNCNVNVNDFINKLAS